MRTFNINFNLDDPCPDGKCLGRMGEKNASELLVTPPAEMSENENITYYIAAFSTEKGAERLGPYEKAEQITVPVTGKLTVGYSLAFQLEGYDDSGETVIKSPLLSGFSFEGAVHDCDSCITDDEEFKIHFHKNYNLLSSLSYSNGILMCGNEKVGRVKPKTKVLLAKNGEAETIFDFATYGTIHFIAKSGIKEGIEILGIEFKTEENGEWIDLRAMRDTENGDAPCIISVYKSYYEYGFDSICLGYIIYINEVFNKYYHEIKNGNFYGIRVTYIDESEAE